MKKLLLVAYLFPPTATTGVHRAAKFVKYLGGFEWQVTVITAEHSVTSDQDNSLCSDFPDDLRVIKVSSFERSVVQDKIEKILDFCKISKSVVEAISWRLEKLYRNKEIPDQHAPWAKKASKRAVKLLESENFDAILTTSWPYSDHLVGLALTKKFGIPWIADFRDPWIAHTNYHRSKASKQGKIDSVLELNIINSSQAVLGPTGHMIDTFRQYYPDVDSDHFRLVRNGYDADDFPVANERINSGGLAIAFVGSFYRHTSPLVMVRALTKLSSLGVLPDDLQVTFVGSMGGYDHLFEEYAVNDYCNILGYQPAKECYHLVTGCEVLWFNSAIEDIFAVPGKVYEYLAMNKTIIASVPKQHTETMGILEKAGGVLQVDPDDHIQLADVIYDLVSKKKDNAFVYERDSDYVGQFSRKAQAKVLAGILEEISANDKIKSASVVDL